MITCNERVLSFDEKICQFKRHRRIYKWSNAIFCVFLNKFNTWTADLTPSSKRLMQFTNSIVCDIRTIHWRYLHSNQPGGQQQHTSLYVTYPKLTIFDSVLTRQYVRKFPNVIHAFCVDVTMDCTNHARSSVIRGYCACCSLWLWSLNNRADISKWHYQVHFA